MASLGRIPGRLVPVLASLALLAPTACSTTRPYREGYPENLSFSSPGLESSILGSPRIHLHLYYVEEGAPGKEGCELNYRGSVSVSPGDGASQLGLPTDREVFARIFVRQGDWLRNSVKTRTDEFRLRPRPGLRYDVQYVHKKNMYARRISEIDPASGRTRELRPAGWGGCRIT